MEFRPSPNRLWYLPCPRSENNNLTIWSSCPLSDVHFLSEHCNKYCSGSFVHWTGAYFMPGTMMAMSKTETDSPHWACVKYVIKITLEINTDKKQFGLVDLYQGYKSESPGAASNHSKAQAPSTPNNSELCEPQSLVFKIICFPGNAKVQPR